MVDTASVSNLFLGTPYASKIYYMRQETDRVLRNQARKRGAQDLPQLDKMLTELKQMKPLTPIKSIVREYAEPVKNPGQRAQVGGYQLGLSGRKPTQRQEQKMAENPEYQLGFVMGRDQRTELED